MKIRSITYFCNPGWPLDARKLQAAGLFLAEAKANFEAAGLEVQTTRLATIPFPAMLGAERLHETANAAAALAEMLVENGIDYASLGPALTDQPESYRVIPDAVAASSKIFFSGMMVDGKHAISLPAIHACAEVIVRLSHLREDGFANLNFAALANVPPGVPYFPASYHKGNEPAFAIAMEAADAAVQAFTEAGSLEMGRAFLVQRIEEHAKAVVVIAETLKFKYLVRFGGIDFSLAPFPHESRSLGEAFERMGVPRVGMHGSLAATAILAEAVDRAHFPRVGFSSVMLPVLEDSRLAERAAEGRLTVKDLLLYSTVCSIGLDTVPLAGDITADQLSALLLDVSALATRLDKPLTARLMPIPGKQPGDLTGFNFGYFANSRVMALRRIRWEMCWQARKLFDLNPRIR